MAFVNKWPRELRDAVLYVVLDLGKSAAAAHALAVAGELPQLKPGTDRPRAEPDLPLGTVRDWARNERVRRRSIAAASSDADTRMRELSGRLVELWAREVGRAESQAARGKLEPARLQQLARAGRECRALVNALGEGGSSSAPAKPAASAPASPAGFLDALAAEPDSEST